jgi:hypothetical protein
MILSSSLHRLFDRYVWTFDIFSVKKSKKGWCNLSIIINNKTNSNNSTVSAYKKSRIEIPITSLPFLYCHYRVFFILNYTTYSNNISILQLYDHYQQDINFKYASIDYFTNKTQHQKYVAIIGHRKNFNEFKVVWEYFPYTCSSWITKNDIENNNDILMYMNMIENKIDPNFVIYD